MSNSKVVLIADLVGSSLNYAVSMCESDNVEVEFRDGDLYCVGGHFGDNGLYTPSEDFEHGVAVIMREGIATRKSKGKWYAMTEADCGSSTNVSWTEKTGLGGERYGKLSYEIHLRTKRFEGETLLIAGLRAYVASKLGKSVDVPVALLE